MLKDVELKKINLDNVDGISYTIYREVGRKEWAAFVHPTDGVYTHRDFLLEQMKRAKSEFSSCGILLYDSGLKKWFKTFELEYDIKGREKRTAE